MMPFLFKLPMIEDAARYGMKVSNPYGREVFIVKVAAFDYKEYDSSWMHDSSVGNACLAPDVDMTYEQHTFNTEEEALKWIREWWKEEDVWDEKR